MVEAAKQKATHPVMPACPLYSLWMSSILQLQRMCMHAQGHIMCLYAPCPAEVGLTKELHIMEGGENAPSLPFGGRKDCRVERAEGDAKLILLLMLALSLDTDCADMDTLTQPNCRCCVTHTSEARGTVGCTQAQCRKWQRLSAELSS